MKIRLMGDVSIRCMSSRICVRNSRANLENLVNQHLIGRKKNNGIYYDGATTIFKAKIGDKEVFGFPDCNNINKIFF